MQTISKDLPEYLHSRYSNISKIRIRIVGKSHNPPLDNGISEQAPDFFKLKNVPILTKHLRNKLHEQSLHFTTANSGNEISTYQSKCFSRKYSLPVPYVTDSFQGLDAIAGDNTGYFTGFRKQHGEFLVTTPKIMRNLQTEQHALTNVLTKICRVRKKRSEKKEDRVPITMIFKVAKKAKKKTVPEIECISPPVLPQHESRLLYKIQKK